MVLEAKCYVNMISPLASHSAHVRLHAAEPRSMCDFRKYAQSYGDSPCDLRFGEMIL